MARLRNLLDGNIDPAWGRCGYVSKGALCLERYTWLLDSSHRLWCLGQYHGSHDDQSCQAAISEPRLGLTWRGGGRIWLMRDKSFTVFADGWQREVRRDDPGCAR